MSRLTRLAVSPILAALACAGGVFAHPPDATGSHDDHHHVDPGKIRAWTNARSGEVVRGAFLAARTADGAVRVSIERQSGDIVVFPLADLADADRAEAQHEIDEVKAANELLTAQALARPVHPLPSSSGPGAPAQAAPFNAFAPFVSTRWDSRWLYVESDGLPHAPPLPGRRGDEAKPTYVFSHPVMVGITAWQQQVPLPQNYRGTNAWQIPLAPEVAERPVSSKEHLFRGAIALAANGVPIFNPIKNDGKTDTFLAGELDDFGGHCGRADDYHYHVAPMHLQKYVGAGAPIAYALDGFPIYGLFDPAARLGGSSNDQTCPLGGTEKLDELNGHYGMPVKGSPAGTKGLYHYHASAKYPYLNGGMRGVVTVKDDQIDPQPRAHSPRAALPPLRGAKITGFKGTGRADEPAWSIEYLLGGKRHHVNYRMEQGQWVFDFIDPTGATKTESYDATNAERRPAGRDGREDSGGGRSAREGRGVVDAEPARRGQLPRTREAPPQPGISVPGKASEPASNAATSGLTLASADVTDGRLSIDCTCDGKGRSPSLSWGEPPAGTNAFAVVMHHVARDGDTHVYMVVANIPSTKRELTGREGSAGTWGQNTVNRQGRYAPPCSQGPGDKAYTITLFALSAAVPPPPDQGSSPLTREVLLSAIKDSTLATATLEAKYARPGR